MTHEQVAEWDAAYILGALSPADRALFEAHLEECAACRASVAELAPLPGLLSRVPRERAEAREPDTAAEDDAEARARVIDLASARTRRRRRLVWGVSSAAAVIVLAAVVVIPLLTPDDPPGETLALDAVVDVPVSASVDLVDVPWGTRIDMTCRYDAVAGAPGDGWGYALVVVADDGTESELSTWRAYAGSTAELSAGTELAPEEIAAIEVRSIENGAVLLQGDLTDSDAR
ncbi:anti-sigma factor [Microbacterium sp. G2-8]|uniref:anti-sigma factor family protein n=1 Tax=Microbacterium sp. G2-8 TaxID=2842454 RepID=UPI001C8A59DA|nr:zf-HC2 domain-containing protein [Microbacterium sp. G2-8]